MTRALDKLPEPSIQPPPLHLEKRFNDALERAASLMTSVVAALLVLFVVVAIGGVVLDAWRSLARDGDPTRAAVSGLNGAFIVIILLELIHTTLSRGPITTQVQEFIVIGITSAVRTGLETAAARGDHRDTAIDLAITSLAALLLVVALWLVRQRLNVERTTTATGAAATVEGAREERRSSAASNAASNAGERATAEGARDRRHTAGDRGDLR
jgi:phosphate starvation-inducible membrane PsiE